uniref:Uncharacterized protein n=1 Tax=Anguilla anguilla TaxID=7936 RepID=A0A0E9W7J5_ANGAN
MRESWVFKLRYDGVLIHRFIFIPWDASMQQTEIFTVPQKSLLFVQSRTGLSAPRAVLNREQGSVQQVKVRVSLNALPLGPPCAPLMLPLTTAAPHISQTVLLTVSFLQ